jgi:hypothetical protein
VPSKYRFCFHLHDLHFAAHKPDKEVLQAQRGYGVFVAVGDSAVIDAPGQESSRRRFVYLSSEQD